MAFMLSPFRIALLHFLAGVARCGTSSATLPQSFFFEHSHQWYHDAMIATKSLEEFEAEARRFAEGLMSHARHATVVILSGDLGAGKTAFIKAAARMFGIEETVKSPTFIIMQTFELMPGARGDFKHFIHIDAYRLNSEHELTTLGWHELVGDPGNIIFLEWPEKVPRLIPDDALRISIEGEGDMRTIHYGQK